MRFRAFVRLPFTLLAAASACTGGDATAPSPAPRTLVAQRVVGGSLPAQHFCTPASAFTEQWVALSQMTLVVNRGGNTFALTTTDAQGNAQFTINDAGAKVYSAQMSVVTARGVAGSLLPAQDGARELRMEEATTIYSNPADFAGRVFADSAIITDQVHCLTPVGTDSAHVFTVILK